MTPWRKVIFLLFFLLAAKQNVSGMMSWGMSLFRNKRSFYLLSLSSAGVLPSLWSKAEKRTPCWETGDPPSPKRQSGMWELSDPTGSGTPTTPWAQEITCSSWGLSQPSVFPLQLVFFLVGGVSCHCWMNSSFLLMNIVKTWKSTSQYRAEYYWELWALWHLDSLGLLQDALSVGKKNILLFEASTADSGWSPPAMSELVLCVVWGFFIMFVLQVEIMFPSGRHLMAFVGGISFTQWWICCSEWECCLGLLKSGGGTLELSNVSVVYMRLPRRKNNTFGKLCSQKQQQAGKEKGRSCEGACLNSGCVHVWWGARERKCGRFAWQCRNQLCVLQQKRPEVGKKGELPPVIGATASGFPLWPPCSAGETSFGFGMSSCNSSCRGISLSRYFLQVLILKRSEGISGMHVGLGFLFGWFLVWRIQALSIFPQSCAFSCFQ